MANGSFSEGEEPQIDWESKFCQMILEVGGNYTPSTAARLCRGRLKS